MLANQNKDEDPPTQTAVRCGRAVFYIVGCTIVAVPLVLASGGIVIDKAIEWLVVGAGIALIMLGAILPPEIVARWGFNLPLFLPDDD